MNELEPGYLEAIKNSFRSLAFVADVGIEFVDCGPGWCETRLVLQPKHLQYTGAAHAGVQATLADHTAGVAAVTLLKPPRLVLTVDFKLSLLRAASGESLRCRAEVLKSGKQFTFTESEVFAESGGQWSLVSKAASTLTYVLPQEASSTANVPRTS